MRAYSCRADALMKEMHVTMSEMYAWKTTPDLALEQRGGLSDETPCS